MAGSSNATGGLEETVQWRSNTSSNSTVLAVQVLRAAGEGEPGGTESSSLIQAQAQRPPEHQTGSLVSANRLDQRIPGFALGHSLGATRAGQEQDPSEVEVATQQGNPNLGVDWIAAGRNL